MKKVLVLLISLFSLNLAVNAGVGTGICYGQTTNSENYCSIPGVNIGSTTFTYNGNTLTNGKSASAHNYYGTINGATQNMYCIDFNLKAPTGYTYTYARALNIGNSDYDLALAKVYQLVVNAAVYNLNNGACTNPSECFNQYLQAVNIVMRTITTKFGYNSKPSICGNYAASESSNPYINVAKQLSGQTVSGTQLSKSGQFELIQRWYCSAILTSTSSKVTAADKTYCNSVPNVSSWAPNAKAYKLTMAEDTSIEQTTTFDGDRFTKVIPVKITGLSSFGENYETWKKTNPYVKITGVSCANNKLTCSIDTQSANILNANLITLTKEDTYTVYVKVTGNTSSFKNATSEKINISYEKYHIMDPDNLGVIRGYGTGAQGASNGMSCYQRMVVIMPVTPQKASVNISISLPSVCRTTKDKTGTTYYVGGKETTVKEYLNNNCCNDIDLNDLTDEADKEYYAEYCQEDDIVKLVQECGQTCDNKETITTYSESYVDQIPMLRVQSKVKNAEQAYLNGVGNSGYSSRTSNQTTLEDSLKKYELYRDNVYDSEKLTNGNTYCKVYTAEDNYIYYPSTTVATSGRFFVFGKDASGNYTQPYLKGSIDAQFHSNYNLWKSDYEAAIKEEKEAYEAWEIEKRTADAISHYKSTGSGTCEKTVGSGSTAHQVTCGHYTDYAGTNTGTYYNAPGSSIGSYTAYKTVATGCCSGDAGPSDNVPGTKATYDAKKATRIQLEKYKTECDKTAKDFMDNWTYVLEPDLTFSYKQEYYDTLAGKKNSVTEDVPLTVSYDSSKYWPNASDKNPTETLKKGAAKTVPYNYQYGGGSTRVTVSNTFDTTEDYNKSYKHTLYYRPDVFYYSLVPSGQYVTNKTDTKMTAIDIGYVFNVQITDYQGEYLTWFTINNIGHLTNKPSTTQKKNKSNDQFRLNEYLNANSSTYTDADASTGSTNPIDAQQAYSSKCIYCSEEVLYERDCVTCEDDNKFKPQYLSRTISLDSINPNGRKLGANWSDAKGMAAKEQIEKLGASDTTYDDYTKKNLEYEFNLTTKDMQEIKQSNKSTTYDDWDLTCNKYGKECESNFVNEYADNKAGRDRWKYFTGTTFEIGSMSTILGGIYPDYDADTRSYYP